VRGRYPFSERRSEHVRGAAGTAREHALNRRTGVNIRKSSEKGVYLRDTLWNLDEADAAFAEVANHFSDRNAADNALTAMARIRETRCRFAEALEIYEGIRTRYPGSRLAINAQQQVLALVPIVRSRSWRHGIEGIRLEDVNGVMIDDVFPGTAGHRSGLAKRMRILTLNGVPVRDVSSFYASFAALPLGTRVRLQVTEPPRFIDAAVGLTDRYASLPPNAFCGD
jgi:hypothetical protein